MQREGGAKTVPPGATSAHMTQLIMPQHANSLGEATASLSMTSYIPTFCQSAKALRSAPGHADTSGPGSR